MIAAEQLSALEAAAEEGIDFDGLRVAVGSTGFRFETPDAHQTGLDADRFREVASEAEVLVSNWYHWQRRVDADPNGGRYAFLRWLERADERPVATRYDDLAAGSVQTWGQLAITVRLGESGQRRYDLRHVADTDADPADLTVHNDPGEAREIARFDERGRYRPLATAPTLRTGWRFEGLDGDDIVRTIDFIYPATVANWHREQKDSLDVTHWNEVAKRQTGIYDVIEELPTEAVEWAVEACCVDSQCLKHRRWDIDESTPIDVARGDGMFPCREPCSLLIAAAREWSVLEREESDTYEFELTQSEKEQLEDIVDAVAEGRIEEIREADLDDAANRYRARYIRAKLFDGEGNLDGVPTEADSSESDSGGVSADET